MKAERRHQLQDNSLAKHLETFPEWLKRNASKIMLAITAVMLVIFVYRYRVNAAMQRGVALSEALVQTRELPTAIRNFDLRQLSADDIARYRQQATTDMNTAIETILREAEGNDGASFRAEALAARGDLNWMLANVMSLPGATTQPSLQMPKSREDYLKAAEDAYRDVVSAYATQTVSWTSAMMGLAAIAETRHDWDSAKQSYAAIITNPAVSAAFQQVASRRLTMLPQIESPVLLTAFPPATEPATKPALPANAPITAPIPAPLSQPSSQPAR